MKKRFIAKNKNKNHISMYIFLFIVFFIITFCLVTKNLNIDLNNPEIVSYLLNTDEKTFTFESLISAEFLLNYSFNVDSSIFASSISETNLKQNPIVYIYNTHPTEYYEKSTFEIFNVTPTVITASYMLQEYLAYYNITAIVETQDVTQILYDNNWTYSSSYDASRILLLEAIEEYPTVEYYIDIHRDAATYESSTTIIDGESCARLALVVGADYEGYEPTYTLAKNLNEEFNKIDESFGRGVILKSGSTVNGVYNQDLSDNIILLEVGAQYNTIDEVNCAISYFSEILANYILEA